MITLSVKRYLTADARVYGSAERLLAASGVPFALHGQTADTLGDLVSPKFSQWLATNAQSHAPLYLHDPTLIHAEWIAAALAHMVADVGQSAFWLDEGAVYDQLRAAIADDTVADKAAIIRHVIQHDTLFVIGLGHKIRSLARTDWFAGEMGDIVTAALHHTVRVVITSPFSIETLPESGLDGVATARIQVALRRANVAVPSIKPPKSYAPAAPHPCACPAHPMTVAQVQERFPILSAGEALAFCDDHQLPPYYDHYTAQQLAAPGVPALMVPRLSDTTIPALPAPVRNRSADLLALSRQLGRASSGTCRQTGKDAAVCETRPFWQNGVMRQQHIANWHSVEPVEQEAAS